MSPKKIQKKLSISFLIYIVTICAVAQNSDTAFFPQFQSYSNLPILKYGDGFTDATWNDPMVLKENGQYIMYISSARGIFGAEMVKIYRMLSADGYTWNLSPSTPVLQPDSGTYYSGGTETPSVVYFNNQYHMYTTSYTTNVATDFVIAHATSNDGINWQMDTQPILESNDSACWYGTIVGEPGAIVYNDSIYLFFTGSGTQNSNFIQCIGLIRSANGTNFTLPEQAVTLPVDVYPPANGWVGLSTPSALSINDSIYLFTDVAKSINGEWTQAALHQFKKYGNSTTWYHSPAPIYTMQDFSWTNGNYLSEIRSINALMDDNNRLRIWYAGNHVGDISGTDTTYNVIVDSMGIHVNPNYWGIGTSDYQFNLSTGVNTISKTQQINVYPNPANNYIFFNGIENSSFFVINSYGQKVNLSIENDNRLITRELSSGTYCIVFNNGLKPISFVVSH